MINEKMINVKSRMARQYIRALLARHSRTIGDLSAFIRDLWFTC